MTSDLTSWLATVQARCDAATQGPWKLKTVRNLKCGYEHFSAADRDFISNARTDLPRALAEIRRLQRELEQAKRG